MSKKIVLGLVLLSALAACQQQPQPQVSVTPGPVMVQPEPVYQGKYGAN
ncbi:MAG: hypothetical protein Q4G22_06640 [Paracoccus sp. (in: a-proteobacteria)]|nr:hypothetical protein [Paracoccus sp. (in: a-proteobacteria)]MDO5631498.1 hypothetical protein [Paracoccus sp. (in: a-proteobacteria)]